MTADLSSRGSDSVAAPRSLPLGLVALWPVVETVATLAGIAVVEAAGGSRERFGQALGAQELGLLVGLPLLALLFLRRADRDGQAVAFRLNRRLLLIGVAAGAALILADVADMRSTGWPSVLPLRGAAMSLSGPLACF